MSYWIIKDEKDYDKSKIGQRMKANEITKVFIEVFDKHGNKEVYYGEVVNDPGLYLNAIRWMESLPSKKPNR